MPQRHLPKIGVALSSGGPRGLAHIGVLRALHRNGIPIDYIAGTSAGAIIGGLYAIEGNIAWVEERLGQMTNKEFFRIFSDPNVRSGLIKGINFLAALEPFTGTAMIETLKTPIRIVATDIFTGLPKVFSSGGLAEAIRASASVPFIFEPHRIGDSYYIDGAISKPMPVSVAKDMGAEIIIAVNTEGHLNRFVGVGANGEPKINFGALTQQTMGLLQYNLAREELSGAQVVIEPTLPEKVGWDVFLHIKEIVDAGDLAAEAQMDVIKSTIVVYQNKKRHWWEPKVETITLDPS